MKGISAFISPSEWFSSTNTRTLVTAPGRPDAGAPVVVVVARVAARVVAVSRCRLDDAVTVGVGVGVVAHPTRPTAIAQAVAEVAATRRVLMHPVKRKR